MESLLQKILDKPESILALCAIGISFISLITSIYFSIQNRKNNRLSVRPLAYILPPDYETFIAVIIQNKGTGPLISKELKFVDENNIEKDYLIDFMPQLDKGYYWSTYSKTSKIVLSPLDEKILLKFEGDINDPRFIDQRNKIRKALSKVEIRMKYTSIFEESFPFELNYKLEWFGRRK